MSISGAYRTEYQTVIPALTTEEMREMDAIATEETGPNLFQMMENAGRSLALGVLSELSEMGQSSGAPGQTGYPIVILAGTGGNGGGGMCAARHLANRGLDVTLCVSRPDALDEVPRYQKRSYSGTNGAVVEVDNLWSLQARVVVDAVLGYSLEGAPRDEAKEMLSWAGDQKERFGAHIVSLDVPSGLDATSGDTPGAHIDADVTVTLALPKAGLHPNQHANGSVLGRTKLADLGIPSTVYTRFGSAFPFQSSFLIDIEPAGFDR